jgi:E3 ubiquitin-protein ligase synoviolin
MTVRSFIKRINDFVRYRNATRDMNARYPDATAEELVRENTCIVCREEMRPWVPPGEGRAGRRVDERQRAKKLPCGHILHFSCLRSWLERQQVCPTCRRSVLAEATPQNGPTNNQANQAQQNQGNPQGLQNPQNHQQNVPRIGRLFNMEPQNQQQPNPVGQPGQQAQQAQQALLNRPPNGAAGNMRVFNFGPIRIALGNLRIPNPQQQQGNANEALNNNNVMANLAQQLAQNPNGQVPTPNQPQDQSGTPAPNYHGVTIPASHAVHPTDIQSDILRLQQNIIDSLRVLNAQYGQLEYIHALLGELNRLQQASGVAAPNAQGPSSIQALNSTSGFAPIVPQAYMSSGSVLRQGDSGLPEGLVLPEGWTLRPLAPTTPVGNGGSPTSVVSAQASTAPGATDSEPGTSAVSTTLPQAQSPEAGPSSSATPGTSGSTEKQAEPSSLASSWSFENTRGTSEASGSTSALAGGNTGNQNTPKRSATVEDTEDSGQ